MNQRITHLAKAYFPIRGGIENLTQLFCEGQLENGANVRVISFADSKNSKTKMNDSVNGIQVLRLKSLIQLYSQPISFRYLKEAIKAVLSSKEVHVHWPNFLAFLALFIATYLIPKAKRARIIIHWHGDAVRQRPLLFLFSPIVKRVIDQANQVVVATRYYFEISDFKEDLQKKNSFEFHSIN